MWQNVTPFQQSSPGGKREIHSGFFLVSEMFPLLRALKTDGDNRKWILMLLFLLRVHSD